jgi:hypothetical protein
MSAVRRLIVRRATRRSGAPPRAESLSVPWTRAQARCLDVGARLIDIFSRY